MGHAAGKDIYKQLAGKIDGLAIRTPFNQTFYDLLKELYSSEEADVVIKMPFVLSDLNRITKVTKYEKPHLEKILQGLCAKGLVMDMWIKEKYYYMPSPMFVGIFELTMMRVGEASSKWAKFFYEYMHDSDLFKANFSSGEKISIARALPHEEVLSEYTEILDYEKATALVGEFDKFSISICSCRHEKHHLGKKTCDTPLEVCTSFGMAADYLIRNNLAKKVSKEQIIERIEASKEASLVLNADNVQKNITFICHCCSCCCNLLAGIKEFGYPNTVVTSNFIAKVDQEKCGGVCGKCAKACAIGAITIEPLENPTKRKRANCFINEDICLGCGVCALNCKSGVLKLVKRKKRVLHPETTFERVILQSLERGTLQNLLFANPQSITQDFMRGFVGGFLRLKPVKRALISNTLRSTFLAMIKAGSIVERKGHMINI